MLLFILQHFEISFTLSVVASDVKLNLYVLLYFSSSLVLLLPLFPLCCDFVYFWVYEA
jgi:hypothetical protein